MRSSPAAVVIPVLDLQAGTVVRAVRGERGHYQPMRSRLAAGSAPLPLARALLDHPACQGGAGPLLYLADLDAIQGRGVQTEALRSLLQALRAERPGLCLWLDAGFTGVGDAQRTVTALSAGLAAPAGAVRPVHGSESLASVAELQNISKTSDAILSLDTRGDEALDPAGCARHPAAWPATLIVMTLDRVGADAGPDLSRLKALRAQAGGRTWVGAGGIRDRADLVAGRAAGASAWLVASALHDGKLDHW